MLPDISNIWTVYLYQQRDYLMVSMSIILLCYRHGMHCPIYLLFFLTNLRYRYLYWWNLQNSIPAQTLPTVQYILPVYHIYVVILDV